MPFKKSAHAAFGPGVDGLLLISIPNQIFHTVCFSPKPFLAHQGGLCCMPSPSLPSPGSLPSNKSKVAPHPFFSGELEPVSWPYRMRFLNMEGQHFLATRQQPTRQGSFPSRCTLVRTPGHTYPHVGDRLKTILCSRSAGQSACSFGPFVRNIEASSLPGKEQSL